MPSSDLEVAWSLRAAPGSWRPVLQLVCTLRTALPPRMMAALFPSRRLNEGVFLALRPDQARQAEVEATEQVLEPNCQGSPQLCLFLAV